MLESKFKRLVINELLSKYPKSYVIRTDPEFSLSYPDLIFLNDNFWAAFEIKRGVNAHKQPNQIYHVNEMNKLCFARFLYPENRMEVMYDLERAQ